MLDLEEKYHSLDHSKQDKPSVTLAIAEVSPNDLTRGNLQGKLYKVLIAAGDTEQEVALKIHQFLNGLQ
jgi:hypothetical protein